MLFHWKNEIQQQDDRNVGSHNYTSLYQNKAHVCTENYNDNAIHNVCIFYFLLAGESVIKVSKKSI